MTIRQVTREIVTAPAVEPVSSAEAKLHLRVDVSTDDALIATLIKAARRHVENVTNSALISQTWDVYFEHFGSLMELPLPPLQSVTSVKYLDTDGTQQTLSDSVYRVLDGPRGRIELAYGQSWPSLYSVRQPITVRMVCGYGDAGTDVPESILAAMKMLIAHWYENREAAQGSSMAVKPVPMAVTALLTAYCWDMI